MEKIKKNFYIFGSGGHAKSCIDLVCKDSSNNISAIVFEDKKPSDSFFQKFKLIRQNHLKKNYNKFYAIIGIGQIKSNLQRKKILKLVNKKKFKASSVIASSSNLSKNSIIGDWTIIMQNTYIGPSVSIGKNCIINNGSIIEHDVIIGNHCHIGPGCILNGNVKISDDCFIGSGSIIKEGIKIKKNSVIPMGSVIKKNV